MYDRPSLDELLDAVQMHLETNLVPVVRDDRKLYFQTLVAVNVLRIALRELELGAGHAHAEWSRLNALMGEDRTMPKIPTAMQAALKERNAALAEMIRAGDYDEHSAALFEHLHATVIEQLEVANPRVLARLIMERQDPSLDAWHGR